MSFTVVRPIARRHINMPPQLRTGTAALIGRTAIVTERIVNDEAVGAGAHRRRGVERAGLR